MRLKLPQVGTTIGMNSVPGFITCGEGTSDLYVARDGRQDGPLKIAVDKLLNSFWRDSHGFEFRAVGRNQLSKATKNQRPKLGAVVRGHKEKYPGLRSVAAFAACLAQMAQIEGDDWGVIFFEDLDFHADTDIEDFYKAKIGAMHKGFDLAQFKKGVPMVPKPRSESWLLCYYQETPYEIGNYFENLAGSDQSLNSGKKRVARFFGVHENQIYGRIKERIDDIDWSRIDAPSFVFFKNRLHFVSAALLHENYPENLTETNTRIP